MSARAAVLLRSGIVVAALLALASCARMTRVDREDWGAITADATVRVTLVDGTRRSLRSVVARAEAVEGVDLESDASIRIPLDSIEYLENRSGVSVFPVLLAVAAGITAIAIIDARGESDVRPPPQPSSCPFIYSFDGDRYVFDSETFAGAVTRGLARTDVDNLEHLRPHDGTYRLLLTNERPETQYTDELMLLVVDHPEGTTIHPDARGTPRVLAGALPAVAAAGLRGGAYEEMLSERDGRSWTGDPLETADLSVDGELRDGVVLTFPRPATRRGLLAVHARNTELAPLALQTFLELHGDGLVDWYRRVDHDPSARAGVREWVMREGTLHVSVWVDGAWRLQDMLLDVGPLLAKTQIAELDLEDVEGDEIRVKLESARGLWAIDRVALGSELDVAPRTTALAPARAVDARERDLSDVLAARDEAYYTALEGDRVELSFPVPPGPQPGWTRTVLARSSGFYHIHTNHAGPARTQLADRILTEPLFGNRYLLRALGFGASPAVGR